jgi:exosortase
VAILLLTVSMAMRYAGDALYLTFLDGWSLLPWAGAFAAFLGGWPLLCWAAPAIALLFFMVPLPFSLEMELSGPLQRVATILSTQTLQLLGRPAFAEGNIIVLGAQSLEVAQACSGLRLLTGATALAYAYAVMARCAVWEKLVLVTAAVPIAITSNVARIVATGVLYEYIHDAAAQSWTHNVAGRWMIAVAAVQFWMLLWYLRKLLKEEEVATMVSIVKRASA